MSVGVVRWVEVTVLESTYFQLCVESTPTHLALLDEVAGCHPLLHPRLLTLLITLFESKQDALEILVQVSLVSMYRSKLTLPFLSLTPISICTAGAPKNVVRQNGHFVVSRMCRPSYEVHKTVLD